MKAMKLMMMAVLTVLMGTSLLTSCLNSNGDSRRVGAAIVNVYTQMGTFAELRTDDGFIFHPSNPSLLQYDNNGVKTYMERALIQYYVDEDQIIDDNTKELNIEIAGGRRHNQSYLNYSKIEGNSSFKDIVLYETANNKHLDFIVAAPFTSNDKFSIDNYRAYLDKAENETIYINLVNLEEADNYAYQYIELGFYINTPTKSTISGLYPDFTYNKNDSAYVMITAKAPADKPSDDIKSKVYKIKIDD